MPLTPEDVRNKQFTTVRLREGYDEDEVDAFLDEVEAELTRLLRENEDLRAKLAAATRAAAQNQQQQGMRKPRSRRTGRGAPCPPPYPDRRSAAARADGPAPAARSAPAAARRPDAVTAPGLARWAAPQWPAGPRSRSMQGGPAGRPHGRPGPMGSRRSHGWPDGRPHGRPRPADAAARQGPGGDSAARVLSLAQQTADQAIAEARSEANKIVGEARSRAEGLERDARAKADALERDAQEKHRVAMGSLESARATLERKVEDLRGFEREYRTRLKSYLESQLRQLETQADDSLAPPRTPAAASLPPSPVDGSGRCGRDGSHHGRQPRRWAAMGQPWAATRPWAVARRTAASSRCPRR